MVDCLIVGGGPAGLTAGIYLTRFHRSVALVDAGQSRASRIPLSHNYPGFPEGISGPDLLQLMRQQLQTFGGRITPGRITGLKKSADGSFSAQHEDSVITAKTILLATGIADIEPELAGYATIRNQGLVRFCPVCDGFEYTGQRIGIIGNGVRGVREYEFMQGFSDKLTYISLQREEEADGEVVDLQRKTRAVVAGIGGNLHCGSEGGKCIQLTTADGTAYQFDVIYCALGAKIHSGLARELGATHDDKDCLVVNEALETSVPALYAAGDVVSGLDQLAVATGQAAIAATAIHNRLAGR